MIQKIEAETPPANPVAQTVPEVATEGKADLRYFKLTKPITVGEKRFDRLMVDATELTGKTYFALLDRFRKEHPEIYRTSINKISEEKFLSYVLAELNPPMIVEDVMRITFKDLPIIFMQLVSFLFSDPSTSEPEPTTTR